MKFLFSLNALKNSVSKNALKDSWNCGFVCGLRFIKNEHIDILQLSRSDNWF